MRSETVSGILYRGAEEEGIGHRHQTVLAATIDVLGHFYHVRPGHFTGRTIAYAASKGVPTASVAVPLSGIIALLGGLNILSGYKAKYGAWLIVLFVVPVTVMMHNF